MSLLAIGVLIFGIPRRGGESRRRDLCLASGEEARQKTNPVRVKVDDKGRKSSHCIVLWNVDVHICL